MADTHMPKTNIEWVFLLTVLVGIVSCSAFVLIYEIQSVVAQQQFILDDLPEKVETIGNNVLRLCISSNVACER